MITIEAPRARKHTLMQIEPVRLTVDQKVQRPLDSLRVASIAANFRVEAFGVIHISLRDSGELHTIDGQHRVAAAKVIGRGNIPVDAVVWEGLSLAEEAAMFRWLNNTRQIQVLDRFRIRTVEGDMIACTLNNLLESQGWTVRKAKATGSFFAVSALENAYKMRDNGDLATCDALISIATAAWGHDSNGLRAEVVSGLGSLLRRHPDLDKAKLVTELAKLEGGPLGLIGKAKQLRDIRGGRVSDAMAEILTNMINKGRKLNRLPEWRAG